MSKDRSVPDRSQALKRLVAHAALPQVLPALTPRTLTRLYQVVGLNDAGALMAATPPGLLAQALDEAAWHDTARGPRFDADVFVDWLEVWLDAGAAVAAERLWALEESLLTLAFAELLAVDDNLVAGFGDECEGSDDTTDTVTADASFMTIDRFLIRARQPDEWDLAQTALLALWDDDADRLVALLDRLSVVSSAGRRRLHQDVAADREGRREQAGFVSAEAARSFLATARVTTPEALMAMSGYDAESARHLTPPARQTAGTAGTVARGAAEPPAGDPSPPEAAARAEVDALLREAELFEPAAEAPRLSGPARAVPTLLERRLQTLARDDAEALAGGAAELAYLANVLRATPAAGDDHTASTLAAAVTNLGMELLADRDLDVMPGRAPGLIQPFLLGWRALLELPARLARAMAQGLAAPAVVERLTARPWLRDEMERSVDDLRRAVAAEDHESAHEAMALLSLVFDPPACRAARHLLAVPPAFPGALEDGAAAAARPLMTRDELSRVNGLLQTLARGGALVPSAEQGVPQHHQREARHQ